MLKDLLFVVEYWFYWCYIYIFDATIFRQNKKQNKN